MSVRWSECKYPSHQRNPPGNPARTLQAQPPWKPPTEYSSSADGSLTGGFGACLTLRGCFCCFLTKRVLTTCHGCAVPFRIAGSFPVGMKETHEGDINASSRMSLLRCSQNGTSDFLEGGPPKTTHTTNPVTCKNWFWKTNFLVETTFLIHLGSSTVLLGLKNPLGWYVQLIELMEEETLKEVRELPRVRLLTRGGKLGLGSSIWMVSGVLVPLHRRQWAACLKMLQALQTQEWELGIWGQAQEPVCWQAYWRQRNLQVAWVSQQGSEFIT